MTNSFLFGTGNRKLTAKQVRVRVQAAKAHGATFTHVRMPDGWRSWFAGPNYGPPFDARLARDVADEVAALDVAP